MDLHVLVVDDDEEICRMLTMLFEAEGWSVKAASSGQAANVLIKEQCFDVVVTDLRMEDPDSGIDVAVCARACLVPPAVVLLSAYRLERRQWQRFADAYIQKGTSTSELVRLVARLGRRAA
jgi:CheY-like chemotaxis protein